MISITSKSPYAVLALAELGARRGADPVPIGELARRRDVPVQFLEQLFAVLRRGGVISSQRGVKGGYRFAREPSTVTVLEIVELLDGPLGRDAQGVFADAAEAARARARADDHRRRDRARDARRGREHVPHLTVGSPTMVVQTVDQTVILLAGQPAKIWLALTWRGARVPWSR